MPDSDAMTLLETVRSARAEAARQEGEKLEADGCKVEWGSAPGGCTPVRITSPKGEIALGTVCFGRTPRRRCQVCGDGFSVAECDFPTGGECRKCKGKKTRESSPCQACAGTGYQMCNRRLCKRCRAHKEPDEDYCPDHRQEAGFPPLVRREECGWTDRADQLVRRECLHQGCAYLMEFGERVLFFPKRKRAMCEGCGKAYLKVAV